MGIGTKSHSKGQKVSRDPAPSSHTSFLVIYLQGKPFNSFPGMVRNSAPFSIKGSCNEYTISKNRSHEASSTAMESSASSLSYGFLTYSTGLEFTRIPASVSKGSFADIYFFLIFGAKIG